MHERKKYWLPWKVGPFQAKSGGPRQYTPATDIALDESGRAVIEARQDASAE
jgi:hypothetical protein